MPLQSIPRRLSLGGGLTRASGLLRATSTAGLLLPSAVGPCKPGYTLYKAG